MGKDQKTVFEKVLQVGQESYTIYSLSKAEQVYGAKFSSLPFSLKVLLENQLRNLNGQTVAAEHIKAFAQWLNDKTSNQGISFYVARVLMQDFTGVPAIVDLAAMRDALKKLGGDSALINPQIPVDLVIDHSVQVDAYGTKDALSTNVSLEMQRNRERYAFLKWGASAFENLKVVPPETAICHQANLEYLAQGVWTKTIDGKRCAFPDTLVGTDSHTTMINGLGVLGWGVGGIEAEAAMLEQPISMVLPEVVGFKLSGRLPAGATATDLVLTVTEMLRKFKGGVVGKFVEFFGAGLDNLSLADRATIANMAPEYGATCGIFPIDQETIAYLKLSGRSAQTIALVEAYAKEQGMWRNNKNEAVYTDIIELNLSDVVPSIAGPKRPQDRIALIDVAESFNVFCQKEKPSGVGMSFPVQNKSFSLKNGYVAIAAITSCTNTSNPNVMIAAGLVAKNANEKGLKVAPWVKTSLAPGSQVVSEYLNASGLQNELDKLGFNVVGYGCTTCIGNSGPLDHDIEKCIIDNDLIVASVLSGNRNFENRVHSATKNSYLMSPPLVVMYALAGTMAIDITKDPIGIGKNGVPVYFKDLWPKDEEIKSIVASGVTAEMFNKKYADVFTGSKSWQEIPTTQSVTYSWDEESTYIRMPPFFETMTEKIPPLQTIENARILAVLGNSVTTDHISPAGSIASSSPAARYLMSKGVRQEDFNSYGSRRGNHLVMMPGTFANGKIRNKMTDQTGGYTRHVPSGETLSIFDAAMKYKESKTPLVVFAGVDYGMGSSRDWAAKGTFLLGVKAVIAQSFERIHRSNLIGMGVLPLTFTSSDSIDALGIKGDESVTINGIDKKITPQMDVVCDIMNSAGSKKSITLKCAVNTVEEIDYYTHGGILQYVIRNLNASVR